MSVISSTQTIVTEVASRINEAANTAAFEDQIVTDINQCTRDVAASFPNAPFLFASANRTLTPGTGDYAAQSDFEKMYSVTNPARNQKLTWLPTEQADMAFPSAYSGTPIAYTIFPNGNIKYLPTPNAADVLVERYQKSLGTVSAMSSTPPIPTKYNELYCLYGEFRGLRRQQRYDDADDVEAKYEALKQKMIDDLLRQTSEEIPIRSIREFQNIPSTNMIVNLFDGNE